MKFISSYITQGNARVIYPRLVAKIKNMVLACLFFII